MTVKKDGDKWKVDVWPWGRNGKRIRKWFTTQTEAQRFQRYILNKAHTDKDWTPAPADRRTLRDLVKLWYTAHGQHLKDGERRKKKLYLACEAMGEPVAKDLKPQTYTNYRSARRGAGTTAKTCNNELGYINAVYNELHRTQVIDYENPLKPVRPFRIVQTELSYLDPEQITELLQTIRTTTRNPHVLLITKISLATGARWGEGEQLRPQHVKPGLITFVDTKNSKNRSIPINESLYSEITAHFKEYKGFEEAHSAFLYALSKTSIKLPKGQAAHVLRHTFASYFMINGGNILTLQRILGHSSITMTMRYAHLAPDHLEAALRLNPLQGVDSM
ncbi:tyrosine-type recombinase/integrase [Alkalimarinus coralli]|uniref:phage integrase n=1 Tax=Alkalimarinus coralli TaxID=2935863 RepID=UPI00202AFD47|nr:tyrosine-type recombinase/integrase [Alkalimarinus coralli]